MTKKQIAQKVTLGLLVVLLIGLFVLFFVTQYDTIVQVLKNNDTQDISEMLKGKGIFGLIMIPLIQALQMLVVVIPAEPIQVVAYVTYGYWFFILCDLGVIIGATIIYLLVKLFKFDGGAVFAKNSQQIERIAKKKSGKNISTLMFILFLMPIIPFGAICYFGASRKISYTRYILTCMFGVLFSISTSIPIGLVIRGLYGSNIPVVVVILIILAVIVALFAILITAINHIFFKEGRGTPDSLYYTIFRKISMFLLRIRSKSRVKYDRGELEKINGPYLLLTNHASGFDASFAAELVDPNHLAIVMNRDFFRGKFQVHVLREMGVIPKKLFSPDVETVRGILKSIRDGYPVHMCPEGRLSIDGTNYPTTRETGRLAKKLNVPVVIVNIYGSYLAKPKWRKHAMRSRIKVKVGRILFEDEIQKLSAEEIDDVIDETLKYNDFEYAKYKNLIYPSRKKAEGLENVLYHCPHCHEEFSIKTKGNHIVCEKCGFSVDIDEHYGFALNEFNFNNIHDWYQYIFDYEKAKLEKEPLNLHCTVKVKKFNVVTRKVEEHGVGDCYLTKEEFAFIGKCKEEEEHHIPVKHIPALPFACGKEFEVYIGDFLYYFYPTDIENQAVKWGLLVDVINKNEVK